MKDLFTHRAKQRRHRLAALMIVLALTFSCVPSVWAQEETEADASLVSAQSNGKGFENVEQDGGTLFLGTARIPKADGSYLSVKYIYSSGIILNDKSMNLILTELSDSGITLSSVTPAVSEGDVSASSLTASDERQAIFACGSEGKPSELTPYVPGPSVEESFESLFKGYFFDIAGYASLRTVFDGRENITLSDDGQTAYTSLVMDENYVERVINGKTVKILMINSELKYAFRAPKIVFSKDENASVSSSDITVPSTDSTTPPTTETAAEPLSTTEATTKTEPTVTESTTEAPTAAITGQDAVTTMDGTTQPTAAADPVVTVPTSDAFAASETTAAVTEAPVTTTTASTAASTEVTAGASPIVSNTSPASETQSTQAATQSTTASTTAITTFPTTTSATTNNAQIYTPVNPNHDSNIGSQRAIVDTRRLPLNIRSGPGMNYMIVTVLPKGTYVTVLDTENPDWYMIKTMGKVVGYAYSKYIRIM